MIQSREVIVHCRALDRQVKLISVCSIQSGMRCQISESSEEVFCEFEANCKCRGREACASYEYRQMN